MKTILFRGKRIDDGKWIYGGLYTYDTGKSKGHVIVPIRKTAMFIIDDYSIFVDSKTIGQYRFTNRYNQRVFVGIG